jgi:hypothetical protein
MDACFNFIPGNCRILYSSSNYNIERSYIARHTFKHKTSSFFQEFGLKYRKLWHSNVSSRQKTPEWNISVWLRETTPAGNFSSSNRKQYNRIQFPLLTFKLMKGMRCSFKQLSQLRNCCQTQDKWIQQLRCGRTWTDAETEMGDRKQWYQHLFDTQSKLNWRVLRLEFFSRKTH